MYDFILDDAPLELHQSFSLINGCFSLTVCCSYAQCFDCTGTFSSPDSRCQHLDKCIPHDEAQLSDLDSIHHMDCYRYEDTHKNQSISTKAYCSALFRIRRKKPLFFLFFLMEKVVTQLVLCKCCLLTGW